MAATLVLTFADKNGNDVIFSYPHADPEVYEEDVGILVRALIINGSIFATPPVTAKSAKLVITSETNFSV